ncbi:MAG: hypothetical protein L0241_24730, partial [Planctomycetia bacterium]|nr:hypothetical protein [Planctomycetia bacterium]
MVRKLLLASVAVALLAGSAEAGRSLRLFTLVEFDPITEETQPCGAPGPPRSPIEKFATSEVVVTGKVASLEKDLVEVISPYPGAKEKEKYKIAVVKINTALAGAEKLKEIKVGFFPPVKPDPKMPPRRPWVQPELKEGEEKLLFLSKHPKADFYVLSYMNAPVDLKDEYGKKQLEAAKRFANALADPMKGLKSDKPEVRGETAALLLIKYRSVPEFTAKTEEVVLPADESKLILKGLLDADWRFEGERPAFTYAPLAYLAFLYLGLTEKHGWVEPVIAPAPPGTTPPDYGEVRKDAFAKWLAGPGKEYRVRKLVV